MVTIASRVCWVVLPFFGLSTIVVDLCGSKTVDFKSKFQKQKSSWELFKNLTHKCSQAVRIWNTMREFWDTMWALHLFHAIYMVAVPNRGMDQYVAILQLSKGMWWSNLPQMQGLYSEEPSDSRNYALSSIPTNLVTFSWQGRPASPTHQSISL